MTIPRSPELPRPLVAPLSLVPGYMHARLLAAALNRILTVQLQAGELDFLVGRSIVIRVRDAGISYALTQSGKRLTALPDPSASDLMIEATLYDFMLLAGRREDPDTLVFQRRLVMQGDTELGLQVKNFLDSLDAESFSMYNVAQSLLDRVLPLYQRVFR